MHTPAREATLPSVLPPFQRISTVKGKNLAARLSSFLSEQTPLPNGPGAQTGKTGSLFLCV